MMRKNHLSRGTPGGTTPGTNLSSPYKRQNSHTNNNHNASMNNGSFRDLNNNSSNNGMNLPSAPLLSPPRRTAARPALPYRKDSNLHLDLDLSERSNESLTLKCCGSDDQHDNNVHSNGTMSKSSMVSKSRSNRRAKQSHPFPIVKLILAVVGVAATISGGIAVFQKVELNHDAYIREQVRMQEIGPLSKELHGKLTAVRDENKLLKGKLEDEQVEIGALRKRTTKELPSLQQMVEHLTSYKFKMHEAIQNMSRQRILEKFGPGPHYVEVQLAFDPDSKVLGTADRFVLEMAPVELMPHSVYTFLEQVDHKLYHLNAFHRNAEHVIQGGPVGNYLTAPNAGLYKKFVESDFASVLFQEYSPDFKHYKYTMGYAGRPGGPELYINMMDNSLLHGPGGQGTLDEADEADPCFARVVEGHEAVVRMHESSVDGGGYRHMEHNVAIRFMKILPADYEVQN